MVWIIILVVAVGVAAVILMSRRKGSKVRLQQVRLVEKIKVTHDTNLFTFLLENQQEPLGLKVGEHIEMRAYVHSDNHPEGQLIERKYTPVSEVSKKGSFDLLIKIYNRTEKFPHGGKMTQWLDSQPIGSIITIRMPFGRFTYQGHGNILIANFGNQPATFKKVDYLYMVAGGSRITPLYQIIQSVCNAKDPIRLTLLFLNRTEDDILLEEELAAFCKANENLKVYYSVDQVTKPNWTGFSGFINKEKIQQTLGQMTTHTMCLSCGPPILSTLVEKNLNELGIFQDKMFRF